MTDFAKENILHVAELRKEVKQLKQSRNAYKAGFYVLMFALIGVIVTGTAIGLIIINK